MVLVKEKRHVVLNSGINQDSPVPTFWQISQTIAEAIRLGNYKKGDRLPSERQLSLFFNVARGTVRHALEHLVAEGTLVKEASRGVFIGDVSRINARMHKIGFVIWYARGVKFHLATLEILRGINEALEQQDYSLEMLTVDSFMLPEIKEIVSKKGWEGIILVGQQFPDSTIRELSRELVLVSSCAEADFKVLIDYQDAAYRVTEHLLALGHRQIALINGEKELPVGKAVCAGYGRVLAEYGVAVDSRLIRCGSYDHPKASWAFTRDLLSSNNPPTAIITGDDYMAVAALQAMKERGVLCPDDLSLASFNNFNFTEYTSPTLTTFAVPFFELGRELAGLLKAIIAGESIQSPKVLQGRLIIRQSTAAAKKRDEEV